MKFIHTGDLHLDSPMESRFSPDTAAKRRAELLLTLRDLRDFAVREGVRAVIVAGDLFDSDRPSREAAEYVRSVIASSENIDWLLLSGNHTGDFVFRDPPENCRFFGKDGFSSYRYGDTVISGSENPAARDTLALSRDDINIVVLHGGLTDARSGPSAVNLRDYRDKNIDYLALGHYHTYSSDKLDARGIYAYCGTPEARGFDETGETGFILLDTEGGKIRHTFIPRATRSVREVTLDITGLAGQAEIEDAVERAVGTIPGKDILRVTLTGKYPPEARHNARQLEASLSGRFFFSEVRDRSTAGIAKEDYEHDFSLRGEFVRTVLASDKTDEEKSRIIAAGLSALDGEEVIL